MTTVLSFHNSDGCVGRCDAKCHDAKHPECDCICGGANHGCGLQQAIVNTKEIIETMMEQMGGNGTEVRVPTEVSPPAVQLELL